MTDPLKLLAAWCIACMLVAVAGCLEAPTSDLQPPEKAPANEAATAPLAPPPGATSAPQPVRIDVHAVPPKPATAAAPIIGDGENEVVWDSFEGFNHWAVEAADDPTKIGVNKDPAKVSAGRRSLRVEYQAFRKNRSHLRRETSLDLSQMSKMLLDCYADQDGLSLTVAFRLTASQRYCESHRYELKKGWNKDITIDLLGEFNSAERGSPKPVPLDGREDVRRVSIIIHHKPESKGVVFLDNIRFRGWPRKGWQRRDPRLLSVVPSAAMLRQYETLELEVDFEGTYGNYFDPGQVDIRASFLSPEGNRFTAYGFLEAYEGAVSDMRWLVRFTPTEVGRWEYNVLVKTRRGEQLSATEAFDCTESSGRRGFVRRSKRDGRYFEFDNGDFFYPIGQNVCWATNYEPFFKKMVANGENFARIWMCPWHLPLEDRNALANTGLELKNAPGKYSLEAARGLDRIVALAETYGIYLQICLEYHGMVNGSCSENPYNKDNGGPCLRPEDFFVDSEARRLFKQRLRYIVARWGWSTHIMAWELFNEVDLGKYYDPRDVVRWHNEMAGYLKSVDPHKHLVTTSTYTNRIGEDLWKLGRIDYAQSHHYGADIVPYVLRNMDEREELGKPFFIGEFGRGWTADADQKDIAGMHLHAGLWASFMSPAAGAAMPWWWDTHIDAHNLYYHFKALAAFAKGEDRRRLDYKPVHFKTDAPQLKEVDVRGLICPTRCLLWLFNEQDTRSLLAGTGLPRIPAGTQLRLKGMWPGTYIIQYWDTYRGTMLDQVEAKTVEVETGPPEARGHELDVVFPEAERDIACKIIYTGKTTPSVVSPAE